MLQPLGISAEAEAAYVALAPLSSASVDELAPRLGATIDGYLVGGRAGDHGCA